MAEGGAGQDEFQFPFDQRAMLGPRDWTQFHFAFMAYPFMAKLYHQNRNPPFVLLAIAAGSDLGMVGGEGLLWG